MRLFAGFVPGPVAVAGSPRHAIASLSLGSKSGLAFGLSVLG